MATLSGNGSVAGVYKVGETLTVTANQNLTSPTFAWYRDGGHIQGATSSTYTLQTDDVGKMIYAIATATDGGETNQQTSDCRTYFRN